MAIHILFSVAGMSPAVITETLSGLLSCQNVRSGEIHVLTTSFGKKSMQVLVDDKVAAFNERFGTSWVIESEWIEVICNADGKPLDDLRSSADNECAANEIVERVHCWCDKPDVVLHASVAGGRKTMGLYLAQAMSWFARAGDDLSHVLVPESFERDRNFYFPVGDEQEGVVDFALIPFVRMQSLLPPLLSEVETYSERVRLSQIYLADISHQGGILTLNVKEGILSLDDYELVRLQPLSVALYLFLFEYANLARCQKEFYFKEAFDYRDRLSECLKIVDDITGIKGNYIKDKKIYVGLSSLAFMPERCWQTLGGRDEIEARKDELGNAFGKLHQNLKSLWKNASFQVFKGDSKDPCRYVNIADERLRVV
jgi:CRISPR-associated protein (TIGR02584 family)